MTEDKELRQVLDETMDWLSDLPEHEMRQQLPEMRIPHGIDFCWKIGGTEYTVISHFNQSAGEDVFHKIQGLLADDVTR